MTELRNVEADLSRFRARVLVASLVVLICFLLLASRLVYLQVLRHEDLDEQAESNRTAIVPIVPNRGLILDRNGIVLATNYSAYTLEITPSRLAAPLDSMIDELAQIIDIQPRDRRRFKKLLEESQELRVAAHPHQAHRRGSGALRGAALPLSRRRHQGAAVPQLPLGRTRQPRDRLHRPHQPDREEADGGLADEDAGQLPRHRIHRQAGRGAELREAAARHHRRRAGGDLRRRPRRAQAGQHPGHARATRCSCRIDIKLQKLVEDLYGDRRGALVAIDPKTGEVLAFVSKPTFDPNLFVDGIDQENWQALNESLDKPLLNRALRGTYPPGSTYKPFMALAALETGKRTPQQAITDPGYFWFGSHQFRDDKEGGHGSVDMYRSIVQSCDTYYYMLANDMGVDLIHEQHGALRLRPAHRHRHRGRVARPAALHRSGSATPTSSPEQQKWYAGETISLGIGQGYNNFTMLQLAHGHGHASPTTACA